jgi:hypothetical protein
MIRFQIMDEILSINFHLFSNRCKLKKHEPKNPTLRFDKTRNNR